MPGDLWLMFPAERPPTGTRTRVLSAGANAFRWATFDVFWRNGQGAWFADSGQIVPDVRQWQQMPGIRSIERETATPTHQQGPADHG